MPVTQLTDITVRALKAPEKGQRLYRDKSIRGFGIRVSQGGTKTFVVVHGANRQFTTIGRYPILSLSDARTEAKRLLAEKTLGKVRPVSVRFEEARDRFLEASRAKNKEKTVYEYERILNRHFKFGRTMLADISQHEIMRRIYKLADTPSEQNASFVAAKVFFSWCKKNHYIEANPLADLSKPAKTKSRAHVLTPKELATVYQASLVYPYPFGSIVSLLVLTGLRRNEAAALKWEFFDTDERIITIPDTKNNRAHVFPYGDKVEQIVDTIPETSEYLFPATRSHIRGKPTTHFNGWSKAKAQFDATLNDVADYRLHDCRRTFDSTMASLSVPLHVSDKLLNHITGAVSGIRATYNRYSYLDEMRDAISKYEEHLDTLCAEFPAKE